MPALKSSAPLDPIYQAADLLGDAWSWMVLHEAMFHGATRFGHFEARLQISPKVLSARLKTLSAGGVFKREQFKGNGSSEYKLTKMGADFALCLMAAIRWGDRWYGTSGGDAARISHMGAHHRLKIELSCSECSKPLRSRDVLVVSMPRTSSDLREQGRRRAPDLDLFDRPGLPPIARTLKVIGDRWSSLVIRECFLGTKRFKDFEQNLGIAPNILSSRLERLVLLGILKAVPSEDHSARFTYRLTEKGHDLYCVPLALLTWGQRWLTNGRNGAELRHKLCGKKFVARLSCGTCSKFVKLTDLVFEDRR